MNALILENVTLHIRSDRLFDPISLRVEPGSVMSVVGPSGFGKSSLLAYLCGIQSPVIAGSGSIRIGDDDLSTLPTDKRGLGLLFQDALLFPHLSVGSNLLFGLRSGDSRSTRRKRIDDALASVDLDGFADRDPATLSGGQKSRVALLRVLLAEPRALLLDEPFSALDDSIRERVRELVFAEAKRRDLPTLLVTHDQQDVAAAGGAVLQLQRPDPGTE